ncbi:hypothetical protein [Halosimplex amylolyticum]|uniref:hypothetical protein n=1 Tax=Halosimplex amylolyticum TaxID=3396616 RepID=UPI003F57A977
MFDNVHIEVLLESGLLENLALECGEVLEDAENPGFALGWYCLCITYFRDQSEHVTCLDELESRFEQMRDEWQLYEKDMEEPMLSVDAAEEIAELESPESD